MTDSVPDDGPGAAVEQLEHRLGHAQRIDRVLGDALGPGPGREPCVVTATDDDEHRRWLVELVLELPAEPEPTGGRGLAVEDRQVETALVATQDDTLAGRHLDDLDLEVWRRAETER